jgi:hypothetical protein
MSKRSVSLLALALAAACSRSTEPAALKPFVLASRGPGEPEWAAENARPRLEAAGFQVVGRYAPYPGAIVLAVTSAELRAAAARQRFGAYGAVLRVTATQAGGEVQVAWTNPVYLAAVYRLDADLAPVAARLAATLGRAEDFGSASGETARDLRRYRYAIGMPRFDAPWRLARFETQAEAVAAVEQGLADERGKARKVYRVDVSPEEAVFGVALADGCGADAGLMKAIDSGPLRATGALPYELVVSKGEVVALDARFRIPVSFPDLPLLRALKVRCAPGSIEGALRQVAAKR